MPALQGSRAISGAVTPTTNDDGWSLRVTANATVTLTNSGWTVGRSGMFFPVTGAATVTFVAGASVTVRNVAGDLVQNRQYDGATALYTGTNEWTIYGSEDPQIPAGYVTTAMLADDAVTTAKIDAAAITTTLLADGAVTNGKMADMTGPQIKGRVSGTGIPANLSPEQARTAIGVDPAGQVADAVLLCAGTVRNTGAPDYWQPVVDENHEQFGITGVVTGTANVRIDFANPTPLKRLTCWTCPDESMTFEGWTVGASYSETSLLLTFFRTRTMGALFTFDGTDWTTPDTGRFTPSNITNGVRLTHLTYRGKAISVSPRSGAVVPQIQGQSNTTIDIVFKNFDGTVRAPVNGDQFLVTRAWDSGVNPQTDLNPTDLPLHNVWFAVWGDAG